MGLVCSASTKAVECLMLGLEQQKDRSPALCYRIFSRRESK